MGARRESRLLPRQATAVMEQKKQLLGVASYKGGREPPSALAARFFSFIAEHFYG